MAAVIVGGMKRVLRIEQGICCEGGGLKEGNSRIVRIVVEGGSGKVVSLCSDVEERGVRVMETEGDGD
jgi:hypothetical protein